VTLQAPPVAAARADRAACAACVSETLDPFARRYRYAFTACPQCGPALPATWHRPCADCRHEADDPAGRRFRWQGIACHACGPRPRLLRVDGRAFAADAYSFLDDTDATTTLLGRGEVVLVKGRVATSWPATPRRPLPCSGCARCCPTARGRWP
jgi:hydrogenase maturation protein HypF